MANRLGQHFGNYQLIDLLGQGSYAEVYLGRHVRLDLQAAIKVLHGHLSSSEADRFQHEAQTMERLTHPSIVRVFDFAVQDSMPFLIMEYAPGGSMRRRYPEGGIVPLPEILPSIKQVAAALQYAHEQKYIHRDVKPENMLLGRQQEVLLSDFGLATLARSTTSLSTQGTVGTIAYLAPEQIEGHPRAASDQYAFAVVIYEWLCGVRPFEGSAAEVVVKQLGAPPPPLREHVPTISAEVEQVVLRALAKDPKERFASVRDFADALERAIQSPPSQSRLLHYQQPSPDPALASGSTAAVALSPLGDPTEVDSAADQLAASIPMAVTPTSPQSQKASKEPSSKMGKLERRLVTGKSTSILQLKRERERRGWSQADVAKKIDDAVTPHMVGRWERGEIFPSPRSRQRLSEIFKMSLEELGLLPERVSEWPPDGSSQKHSPRSPYLPEQLPPTVSKYVPKSNLPVRLPQLIGRENEVTAACSLLRLPEVYLLTLKGPGGVGKTRLGLQIATVLQEDFVDGVYFVPLDSISDPKLVVPTIAQTFGFGETGDRPLFDSLKTFLQDKHLLLLIDNFEQVSVAATQISELLASSSYLKILVTSRAVLRIYEEHEFSVQSLALPDHKHLPAFESLSKYAAIALFLLRARATNPGFQMTPANAGTIAEICVCLDGLPLAIELAAARLKLFSPEALLTQLAHPLQLLTNRVSDIPVRHLTLRHTIAWSYRLLNAEEQRLFRQISIFVGGCTLEAVKAICFGQQTEVGQVYDDITSLIDKSLVQQLEQRGEETRLRLLETIREYGLERLIETGEMEETRSAHAMYYLALAEEAEPRLKGPQQETWFSRLEREHDNLRQALDWTLRPGGEAVETALRFGGALYWFWWMHCYWSEGRSFLERALEASEGIATLARAKALWAAAHLAIYQKDLDWGKAMAEAALVLCQELSDIRGIAIARYMLGSVAWGRGNYTEAYSLTEKALTLFREIGDTEFIGHSLHKLGLLDGAHGEYARACALLEESLTIQKELGDKSAIAASSFMLARVLFFSGGDPMKIRSHLEKALALCQEVGDRDGIALSFTLFGQLALYQEDIVLARTLAEKSVMLWKEIGDRQGTAEALSVLAKVEVRKGDYVTACARYKESLTLCTEVGDKRDIASYIEGLAGVAARQGKHAEATRLLGVADVLRESIGIPLSPIERADYESSVAAVRTQMFEETFAVLWAEGRTMTLEQIFATPIL